MRIGFPDAAVQAIFYADVRDFDKSPQIDVVADGVVSQLTAAGEQGFLFFAFASEQSDKFFFVNGLVK